MLARNRTIFDEICTSVAISDDSAKEIASRMYEIMTSVKKSGLPVPEHYLVDTADALLHFASLLGWSDRPVVVKPPLSNGTRGERIIDGSIDSTELHYSEKTSALSLTMKSLIDILGPTFPELLVMEYLPNLVSALRTSIRNPHENAWEHPSTSVNRWESHDISVEPDDIVKNLHKSDLLVEVKQKMTICPSWRETGRMPVGKGMSGEVIVIALNN